MYLGYARVSTAKQDLDRQIDALLKEGIAAERVFQDKRSGATTDRPGLRALQSTPARATSSWCTPSTGSAAPSGTR